MATFLRNLRRNGSTESFPNCASSLSGSSRSKPTSSDWFSMPTGRSRSCSDSAPWENGSARWRSN